mmetsp:Transcript_106536/g.301709  ORF Transcript_106536/g.301709 Transcript_106536/m.301709 type:complete len:302 (-) Transcript_106536:4-909(-)
MFGRVGQHHPSFVRRSKRHDGFGELRDGVQLLDDDAEKDDLCEYHQLRPAVQEPLHVLQYVHLPSGVVHLLVGVAHLLRQGLLRHGVRELYVVCDAQAKLEQGLERGRVHVRLEHVVPDHVAESELGADVEDVGEESHNGHAPAQPGVPAEQHAVPDRHVESVRIPHVQAGRRDRRPGPGLALIARAPRPASARALLQLLERVVHEAAVDLARRHRAAGVAPLPAQGVHLRQGVHHLELQTPDLLLLGHQLPRQLVVSVWPPGGLCLLALAGHGATGSCGSCGDRGSVRVRKEKESLRRSA